MKKTILTLALSLIAVMPSFGDNHPDEAQKLTQVLKATLPPHIQVGRVQVNNVDINDKKKTVTVDCNEPTLYLPFTVESAKSLENDFRNALGEKYAKYKLTVNANGFNINDLATGAKRKNLAPKEKNRFITYDDRFAINPTKGLQDANIAVWQSHGWYFEKKLNRWEWQRARIMQTVEDLYTQSYVVPFLMPMLENAGAYVMSPRDRDMTPIEIIIDNNGGLSTGTYAESNPAEWNQETTGFAHTQKIYTDDPATSNPFKLGTARIAKAESNATASWNAEIPQTRDYAVYVSYQTLPKSSTDAIYVVNAANGAHRVHVNQQMGGGTWIYLGHFPLAKGVSEKPVVELIANGKKGTVVTADAVKIGGGMGNIARGANVIADNGDTITEYIASGYPRFTEGARYWLQWAGMPDSVYSQTHNTNDYTDDYTCRAHWVNYMSGGSSMNPNWEGLNIPLDLSFAFHTDAGTTYNDSIIGTLGIYSTNDMIPEGNGSNRLAARDLTDIIMTQIVADVRAEYEPNWTRRGLWDKKYHEARVPRVPAMLLELLSHQNFADMKYGLDPTFRFAVSRAIYKGMGRYLAARDGREFIVQPLAPGSFNIKRVSAGSYTLSWTATPDKLEPTANPTYYIVEQRVDNGAFSRIATVNEPSYTFNAPDNRIYSFRIIAGNDGGVSFPSETLALCDNGDANPVVIVNGFTRISGPDNFEAGEIAGFYDMRDHGVPYIQDINFIGSQFEFRRQIPWMDDDAAGFGASRADYEEKVIAGNTFDYVALHGEAIRKAGRGFVSSSLEAYMESPVEKGSVLDLILGKQKEIAVGTGLYGTKYKSFPAKLQEKITAHTAAGGDVFVSGAYVATDLWDNEYSDSTTLANDKKFATEVLGYHWRVGQASVTGEAYEVVSPYTMFKNGHFNFYNSLNNDSYVVESPDSFYASKDTGATIMRYSENNLVAGIAMKQPTYRTVVIGFPFEAIKCSDQRDTLMKQVLDFFKR